MIKRYNLVPHPEGGYYREIYRSKQILYSDAAGKERSVLTYIYFLPAAGRVSRFHKVVHQSNNDDPTANPLKQSV
ncbi:MAG: cupin domain-containing protein [Proteobacteria bacterium]|nr:cupin domain-containing protein [Pseudomonadota bacterium]